MVNLGTTLDAEVDRLATEAGVGKSEVVRQALRFYLPLEAATAQGVTVLLVHPDGITEQFKMYSIHGTPLRSHVQADKGQATMPAKEDDAVSGGRDTRHSIVLPVKPLKPK